MTELKNLPTLLPTNINWQQIFKNNNPIDLELGMGRPHFFFDRSLNFKERNIIGIEWKYEFVLSAQKRIVRENIQNAMALHGNAWALVPMLFKPQSISSIFVNFPDPWWKHKHKKRLILNDIFINCLLPLLKEDSYILLQTDVKNLFDYYVNLLTKDNLFYLDNSISEGDLIEKTKAKTHREKKCFEFDIEIYRGMFKLRGKD